MNNIFDELFNPEDGEKRVHAKASSALILENFQQIYHKTGEAKIKGSIEFINDLMENDLKFLVYAHHILVLDALEEWA